jgi:hypothetical protein
MLFQAAVNWSSYFTGSHHQADEWAAQLPPGPDQDAFLSGICDNLGRLEPERAANLAASFAAGKTQSDTLTQVLWTWIHSQGAAQDAASWSAALPAGSARTVALAAVGQEWAGVDPTASGEWLRTLPADDARAQAVEAYVSRISRSRPELAAQWVECIADEKKRNQQIESIARQWLKAEPEAAGAWLQQTSLPIDRKQQLLGN